VEGTLNSKLAPAEICRQNGWGPGTKLIGDECGGYGTLTIEITAVGQRSILARVVSDSSGVETMWHLDLRDWKPVTSPTG
jgi:hypothetical protein